MCECDDGLDLLPLGTWIISSSSYPHTYYYYILCTYMPTMDMHVVAWQKVTRARTYVPSSRLVR